MDAQTAIMVMNFIEGAGLFLLTGGGLIAAVTCIFKIGRSSTKLDYLVNGHTDIVSRLIKIDEKLSSQGERIAKVESVLSFMANCHIQEHKKEHKTGTQE